MKNIELLLPAGNLEKLKYALMYGADAVYIGAKKYSLRAQASNFTFDDLKEGVEFAHSLNKRVYVTVNVIPREKEIDGVKEYVKYLESIGVDGVIASSPAILNIIKENTHLHTSISTQASVVNLNAVNLYHSLGYERVVLGRETSIDEIKYIKENTQSEIEVFIHGGMCSGYSGRCTLSNYMSDRDANRGGCAHSCRWDYELYKNDTKISNDNKFQMSSKDLCAIEYIKDLVNLNVDSLKVEGRMKSIHYIATIAYTYKSYINDILNNTEKPISYYKELLESAENRENYSGFFNGKIDENMTLYEDVSPQANQSFLALVMEYDKETKMALVETRNYFKIGDKVEVMSPGKELKYFTINKIIKDGESLNESNHALDKVYISSDIELKKFDILRRTK